MCARAAIRRNYRRGQAQDSSPLRRGQRGGFRFPVSVNTGIHSTLETLMSSSNTKISAIPVTVRYRNSAYETNTVRGQRASSTHSAHQAATVLGHKLLGKGLKLVQQMPGREGDGHLISRFELHGVEPVLAAPATAGAAA